ncbi:hypothetical protein [Mumia sp. Pv 4-285]|uniref:hypothetical protein n=1 Tax=Mumia qirimensis TaxID=3234852 RepID=UPI00351D200F
MHRTTTNLARVAAAVGATVLAGTLLASPADAYGDVRVNNVQVIDTSTCEVNHPSQAKYVYKVNGGCSVPDSADGTFFQRDGGGPPYQAAAAKTEIYTKGVLRGKVEFHPYGEKVWIYDTSNDGDTLWFRIVNDDTNRSLGDYRPPGTSAKLDHRVIDLDLPETTDVRIEVYDDAAYGGLVDRLTLNYGRA